MEYPNWFNYTAKDNFEKFLIPLAGQENLKFLQLGVYTGDASLWLLDNVLTGIGSRLTDVDTWQGSDEEEHKSMDFNDVFTTYKKKIAHKHNINIVQRTTINFLVDDWIAKNKYDFIYIDADHTTMGVLLDSGLSFPLLKSGGIMAFDDYTWGPNMSPELTPTLGIDLFLNRHEGEYETLIINSQVWIKKI